MPRSVAGVYTLPPGSTATTLNTIGSAAHNALIADLEADANNPRPIGAGGTGASTADQALSNLGGTAVGKAAFTASTKQAAQAAIGAELPAGAVMHFAMANAPSGWLKANGQAVSRVTYAALFASIGTTFGAGDGTTTFNVPDLRGEFVRSWDDSRGIDASRALGSTQAAAMLNHTHSGTTSADGAHSHIEGFSQPADGGRYGQVNTGVGATAYALSVGTDGRSPLTSAVGNHTHTLTTGNPSAGGGSETRPRNVALLACIKF